TAESFPQIDLRDITRSPNRIRPTDEMPHLAGTKFAVNFWCDSYSERIGNALRDLAHSHAFAATDVYRQAIEPVRGRGEPIPARDILDERKIARLLTILVKNRRQIIEQARAENRDHAGVGIEDRLS